MKEYEYFILEPADEASKMFADDDDAIEDRARFVRNVGRLAAQTREGVKRLDYLGGDPELVRIVFKDGHRREINITADSYQAIARDIFKHIN